MSKVENWLEFWGKITPAMLELGQAIFRRTGGDVPKALGEIRRIQDHWGKDYAEAEAQIDAELDQIAQAGSAEGQPRDPEPAPEGKRQEDWQEG